MPIVDLESPDVRAPRDTPKGFFVTPGQEDFDIPALTDVSPMPLAPPEKVKPTEQDINRAALRTGNEIASAISAGTFTSPRHIEEGFNAWDKLKGTPDEEHWDRFVDVRNTQHFDIVQRSIQQEREDRKLLDGLPWYQSMPALMMAGILSPTTLLPGGAFVRGAKGGFSWAKSGASVAAWTGASAGVQEVGLHATQSLRTPLESAIDISASTLLGGIIGAAGAKLLTHAQWNTSVKNIDRQAAEYVPQPEMPVVPLGAAAIADPDWIRAFHGSPHDFEKFDLSKIGTGEGAQTYGHGLYFAEHPEVAHVYKQNLSFPETPLGEAGRFLDKYGSREKALAGFDEEIADVKATYAKEGREYDAKSDAENDEIRRLLKSAESLPRGRVYETRIRAKPEEFLDWDKSLAEQSELVRGALAKAGIKNETDLAALAAKGGIKTKVSSTGRGAYHALAEGLIDWNAPPIVSRAKWRAKCVSRRC